MNIVTHFLSYIICKGLSFYQSQWRKKYDGVSSFNPNKIIDRLENNCIRNDKRRQAALNTGIPRHTTEHTSGENRPYQKSMSTKIVGGG